MPSRNIVVTGLPRAGLTLACALIDQLPDAVCLNAPPWHTNIARKLASNMPMCKWLVGDFTWYRDELLTQTPVPDYRQKDGTPFTDGLAPTEKEVLFSKPDLTTDFILGMKHHLLFTAILSQLVMFDKFTVIAMIRHPLDVIASWQNMKPFFIADGGPTWIANMWPEAHAISISDATPLDRMAQLYELFCARYYELREKIHIIKYEDMVRDPMIISNIVGRDHLSSGVRLIESTSYVRDMKQTDAIRMSLKKYAAAAKYFYPDL